MKQATAIEKAALAFRMNHQKTECVVVEWEVS